MLQDEIIEKIEDLLKERKFILIAIDGRCGSGKTSLAKDLQNRLSCNVIQLDDFFLRAEQRSEERLNTPGGNVDYERFLEEVLIPLSKNEDFSYKPYICYNQAFGEETRVSDNKVTIVEGSYSCHPKFWDYFDLHIFLEVSEEEQMRRIINRNGEQEAQRFKQLWIPLEEKYFKTFNIKENCELKYNTDKL